jgi:hypothetical protein
LRSTARLNHEVGAGLIDRAKGLAALADPPPLQIRVRDTAGVHQLHHCDSRKRVMVAMTMRLKVDLTESDRIRQSAHVGRPFGQFGRTKT